MKRIKGEICRLSDLKVGQSAKILCINISNQELRIHLLEMGLIPSTKVIIKKVTPLRDPIIISLRGYELFLPKQQLKQIEVQVL